MPTILLLTVTKIETQTVFAQFGPGWKRKIIDGKTYYALGNHGGAEVYLAQSEMGTATVGGALITAHKAIADLHPDAVIMVGIAFGTKPDKQRLGDILVAKQIMAYEPGKVKGEFIPRGDRVTASPGLLDKFRSGDLDWPGAEGQPGARPAVHFGLVLSGEKLVNDLTFRDGLLALEPEAIGGEMEGAGLYAAAADTRTDWILVKAICDWADGNKDDTAQPLAAANAASFVRHVICLGGWEGRGGGRPGGEPGGSGPARFNIQGGVHASRDVVMGDQYNVNIGSIHDISGGEISVAGRDNRTGPAGPTPPAPAADLGGLRRAYLEHLQRTYHALDFKGIPQLDNFARELALEAVYVPLLARPELPGGETWERRFLAGRRLAGELLPEEALAGLERVAAAPLPIADAIEKHNRVIVLGDPGSGKSTLLKHLALRLAAGEAAVEVERLPILVPLNAYAAALEKQEVSLQDYLTQYFAHLSAALAGLGPLFRDALARGRALVLLDGLDEVQSERPRLVHRVEVFADDAVSKGNRVVVTSRIVGYRDCALNAGRWALHTLLDFDRAAIETFAGQWCLAFETGALGDTPEARAQAEVERRALLEAIEANPGVARLASNPLLLTILALIKRQGVNLPSRRVKLYDLYLETLITAWSKARALDKRQVGPELDYEQTLLALGPLALWLRSENPTAGLASEKEVLDRLTRNFMSENWGLARGPARERAAGFLKGVRQYSNLLLERGEGQYGFIHLTLEEMLAAYGLVQAGELDLEQSLEIVRGRLLDPGWRETILLAVGIWGLVNKSPRVAGKVVQAVLGMACEGDAACQNVLLAGACLEDVGSTGLDVGTVRKVIERVQAAALDRGLPPATQRDAGFILGRLAGANPEFLEVICPDLDEMVQIPAGRFIYQGEPAEIKAPFKIGKYPVTNLQYQRFIDAGGYARREWWSEEGWAWRTEAHDSNATDEFEKDWLRRRPVENRGEPYSWHDAKWNNPLTPVVGVSWFEAEAYCGWLSMQGREVRLPTEVEWERAAAGVDGRKYPWGKMFDRSQLNCATFWKQDDNASYVLSSENASPSLVGQFPAGASKEGVLDMSGNVWEWTGSWHDDKGGMRVLRGGSWGGDRDLARCAFRYWSVPAGFFNSVGFRLVSPGIFLDSAC